MPYYVALPNGSYVEMPDDIPQDQAMREISLDPRFRPIIEQSFEKEKNLLRDVPGYLARGVGQIPSAIGSLINVVPGMEQNIVGRGLRSTGEAISDFGTGILSSGTQKQQALFDLAMQEAESKGLGEQAKTALAEAIRNPRIVAGVAIESLPSLATALVGGLAVRGAAGVASRVAGRQLAQTTATRAGVAGAVGTESLLEGGGSADEVYRTITALSPEQLQRSPEYQELLKQGLNPDEAKERLAVSAARQAAAQTAVISGSVGAVLPGAEGAMFRPMTRRGVVGRALGTSLSELGQEAGQEGGAALSENIARQRAEVDRELLAGVGSRATMGAIVGAGVGAGVGAIRPGPGPEIDRTENEELRNILNEYVNVRGEAPAVPPAISERDAEAAAFVAANLPVSEEMFLAMPQAGRARVMAIARNRADRAAASEQEQGFRQEAETRAATEGQAEQVRLAEEAEASRIQNIADQQARTQEETAAITGAGQEAITPSISRTPQEELSQAVQESRGTRGPVGDATTARYIEARAMEAPNQPISIPAFQQHFRAQGLPVPTLQQAKDTLDKYAEAANAKFVKPRFTLNVENGRYVPVDNDLQAPQAAPLPKAEPIIPPEIERPLTDLRKGLRKPRNKNAEDQASYQARRDAADQLEAELFSRDLTPQSSDAEIAQAFGYGAGQPREEYSSRKPRGPIGGTAPMQVSIPERFAAEAKPAATPEDQAAQQEATDKAQANEARRAEILQKLNDEYLAKLEAKGSQGKRAADAVRKNLQDQTLSAEQLYGAFKGAEIIANTLPANANHEIEFVKYLTDAAGKEVQGKRIEVKDSSSAGIIKLSLAENQLPLLSETASHEAFHVLQDYYGKYDPDFRKLMKQSFRDGMTINDVDSTIKRKLQTIRMPNGRQSYWDILVQSLPNEKLSAREAEAYVFGSLAEASRRGVPMTGMKPAFTRFVNFLTKFFRRMGNSLRGDGFNSPDDVFGRVVEGDAGRFAGEAAPEFRGGEEFSARLPSGNQFFDLNTTGRKVKEFGKTTFEYRALNDGSILLDFLATDPEFLNKGEARNGMQQFVSEADALDKIIRVVPEPQNNETNFNRLVDFYRSLGFKKERGSLRMSRAPMGGEEFSARLAPTIEVDGVQRPTTNSEGRSIHPTEEGVRNFWRWFGDSKVVDENGKPLVVYHGTSKDVDFQSFKMKPRGIWFADNPKEASNYAIQNDSMGSSYDYAGRISPKNVASRVIPSYLSIQNAIEPTQQEMDRLLGKTGEANYARVQGEVFNGMKSRGADGVNMGGGVWVAINSPSQIKSAVGNVGEFSGKNPKIQYSARTLPKISAAHQNAIDKVTGTYGQQPDSLFRKALDALTGARAKYTFLYGGEKPQRVKASDSLVMSSVNQFHAGHLADQLLKSKGRPDAAIIGRSWESANNNDARIAWMMNGSGYRFDKIRGVLVRDPKVKSIKDMFANKVPTDEKGQKRFQTYAVANLERDLRKQGKKGFLNLTDAEVASVIQESERSFPQWKEVIKDLNNWNNSLLQLLVDAGNIDQATKDKLMQVFYTPLYRKMEDDAYHNADMVMGPATAGTFKNPSDALKRREGGEEPIGDLFENIVRNADAIVKSALKNVAMENTAKGMEIAGLAEKVPARLDGAKNIMTLRRDGKDVHYRVDDPLMMIAISTAPMQIQNGFYKTMASVSGFIRDMITLAPSFMLANLWRGKVVSYVQEGVPLWRSTTVGLRDALKQTTSMTSIGDVSGFGGYTWGQGSRDVVSELKRQVRLADGTASMLDRAKSIVQGLRHVGEATEFAERIKVVDHLISKGMNPDDAAFQGYLLAPFSRRGMGTGFFGSTASFLAPIVPFLNAKIQGTYRLLENEKNLPKHKFAMQLMARGAVVTMFSMALAALASDDERWNDEPVERKMLYDIFYVGDKTILLPRAFEVGTWFGALPVMLFDAARKEHGGDLGKAFAFALTNTLGFSPIPASVAPLITVATNYDFFMGRELESAGMKSRPASERSQEDTSRVAEGVAYAINNTLGELPRGMRTELSPIQVQALLQGYLGTAGTMALSAVDGFLGWSGMTPGKPAGPLGDPNSLAGIAITLTGVRRFIKGDEEKVSRFVGDFYDLKREVTQWTTAMNDARLAGDMARANEIASERSDLFSLKKQVDKASRDVGEISRRMRAIQNNPNMDPQEKADALVPLRQRRNEITGRIMEQAMDRGVR